MQSDIVSTRDDGLRQLRFGPLYCTPRSTAGRKTSKLSTSLCIRNPNTRPSRAAFYTRKHQTRITTDCKNIPEILLSRLVVRHTLRGRVMGSAQVSKSRISNHKSRCNNELWLNFRPGYMRRTFGCRFIRRQTLFCMLDEERVGTLFYTR
jgi:hypothetical protein